MKPSIPVGIKLSYLLIMRLDEGRLGDIEKPIQRATILYIVKKNSISMFIRSKHTINRSLKILRKFA
jgi:hypothetical protein